MLHKFRSPFVYIQKVKNHEFFKSQLVSHILEFYNKNQNDSKYFWGNSQTVNNHYHQDKSIFTDEMYNNIIWNPIDNMFRELKDYPIPSKSYLSGIWWNIYPPGSFAESHNHQGNDLSGVYFLHLTEPNTLIFEPPCNDGFFQLTYETLNTKDITEEGDVVIFPSSLRHHVNPCQNLRIGISFNITSNFSYKSEINS